jgi:hypothetical protein
MKVSNYARFLLREAFAILFRACRRFQSFLGMMLLRQGGMRAGAEAMGCAKTAAAASSDNPFISDILGEQFYNAIAG